MAIHILGIRHHGVGSAKQVKKRLQELKPDIVLVEGAPEMTEMLPIVGHEKMLPPVALMVYNTEMPKESSFYPFSEFSPEWVAIQFANEHQIPVRAIDMPAAHSFIRQREKEEKEESETEAAPLTATDPMDDLAKVAGFETGEQFWESYFEHNSDDAAQHFESVMLAMATLREEGKRPETDETLCREAFMRQFIREAQNEMYTNIAVVCGAWHAPALRDLEGMAKKDVKRMKAPRKKIKMAATWIPWTNARLSMASGYGAGILSPGWYAHQWNTGSVYKPAPGAGVDFGIFKFQIEKILDAAIVDIVFEFFVKHDG